MTEIFTLDGQYLSMSEAATTTSIGTLGHFYDKSSPLVTSINTTTIGTLGEFGLNVLSLYIEISA